MSDVFADEDLMRQFCAGKAQAFQLLYARHEKPLYRYVRRLLGSAEALQAEDVFQDTWMKLVDARDSWQARDNASFKTWLYTLAHHRAIDILRKSGREVSADEGWADDDSEVPWQLWPASHAEQPEQLAFWHRAGQQLLHCLDGLPALQRAAFLLHHDDGLSLEEITQVINAEFETVKSRLRYALTKLRACMGAHFQPTFEANNIP
ncbi:MAG: sigma-70 family RNA polymerase sigma factor [Methylotenera sp.]